MNETDDVTDERRKLIAEVRARVEMEQLFGADVYRHDPDAAAAVAAAPAAPAPAAARAPEHIEGEDADKRRELEALRPTVETCQNCHLWESRTNAVFGTGKSDARLMFIGEAPGRDEDEQGEPFVGRAGKLLTRMILAMGLSREEVFIGNVLKCRPPDNRTPTLEEMAVCLPYLMRQIEIIGPEIICALGATALKGLLRDPRASIGKMRGRFIDWNGIRVMPTYHPAYLLRSPGEKAKVWEDLQVIMKELRLPVPDKPERG